MSAADTREYRTLSSIELISLGGFSLTMGWICLSFFWVFCDFPPDVAEGVRDLTQLCVFVGIAVGYLILHFLGRNPEFNVFSRITLAFAFIFSVSQPLCVLAMTNGIHASLIIVGIANFLAGIGSAVLILCWLDILSRLGNTSYSRFTGLSFICGIVLFFFAICAPENMQSLFAGLYVLATIALITFCTRRADNNENRAPLEAVADPWMFTKEIEPSFFVFNMLFALNFIFLFNTGREYVMYGLLATIPGAMVIAVLGMFKKTYSVTLLQRFLLAITVFGCVMLPFTEGILQLLFACMVNAAWAAFMCANYAFIVLKSANMKDVALFRQGASRLSVPALGFMLGWAISTLITYFFGPHHQYFVAVHLIMTVLLVIVVMMFFPVRAHHPAGGGAAEETKTSGAVVSIQMDESELFDKKCEAIVNMYQLSPREADILVYLAKGRNAAWIQEQLVISPHTVKSHIYNIYRKLDIHSQQKLMSFVEEYPLDL